MTQKRFFSLWLCLIIFIIFIIQLLIPSFTELFILNDRANNGEWWRFVSALFLHASIAHVLYNLFALALFGFMLEQRVGSRKFITVFFASGVIANIVAENFYDASLGASGAIYGVIGALTIIMPFIVVFAFGLPMPLILASILWVGGDILTTLGAFGDTTIGTIAHISGIGIGLIIGFMYRKKKTSQKSNSVKIDENFINQWEDDFMRNV